MMYKLGGKKPSLRRAGDRNKESELATLKELFVQNCNPFPSLVVAIEYVRSVSYKMRQYNIDNNEVDNDDV